MVKLERVRTARGLLEDDIVSTARLIQLSRMQSTGKDRMIMAPQCWFLVAATGITRKMHRR